MARKATPALVDAIEVLADAYILQIDVNGDADQTAWVVAFANFAEGIFLDAFNAYANTNAAALINYSSPVGISTTRKDVEKAKGLAMDAYAAFATICKRGGVTLPSFGESAITKIRLDTIGR